MKVETKKSYSKFIRTFVLFATVASVVFACFAVGNAASPKKDPYGIVAADINNVSGVKRDELSEGVKNILKRARQFYEVKWTALSEIESYPGNGQNLYFREGVEYQGLPYGQPVHKGIYVGFGCSINDYVEATRDINSKMYTTLGENTWYNEEYGDPIKYGPYFATDCSGFVSYAWGLSGRNTTGMIAEVTYKEGDPEYKDARFQFVGNDIEQLKVGYALNKGYYHIILIYDIVYDSWGNLLQVTTLEQTTPFMRMRVWGAGGNAGTLEDLQDKINRDGYDIIRYTGMNDVKFEPFELVPINQETYKNNVSSPIGATVNDGAVTGEGIVTEDTYSIEGWTYNDKGVKSVEYSVDGGEWKKAEIEKCGDIVRYKAPADIKITGEQKVAIRGKSSAGEYAIADFTVRPAGADYEFRACFDEFSGLVLDAADTAIVEETLDLESPENSKIILRGWGVCTESVRSFEYRIDDGFWTTLETDFRIDVFKSLRKYKEHCDAYNCFDGVIGLAHLEGGESYTLTVRAVTETNDVFEFASVKINLAEEVVEIFGIEIRESVFYAIIAGVAALVLIIIAIIIILIVRSKKKKAAKKAAETAGENADNVENAENAENAESEASEDEQEE